jgi:membrane-associated phospholipid phosphatase
MPRLFMVARLRKLEARVLPHGALDVMRQVALFATAYWGYRLVRGLVDGRAAESFQNARDLISIERATHTFVEPAIQAAVADQGWLVDIASWMYVNAQATVTLGALIFIYLFHNRSFYFVRNMLMVAMGMALVGYTLFPTAPPRFFPEWGFRDSVSSFTGIPQDSVAINVLFNPFAAVPSMHVAFALMLGWPLARLVHHRAFRVAWFLYPFWITFVVVVTGNHFVLDAVLGALVAAASAWAADRLAETRPAVWKFRRAGAEAPA